VLEEILYTFYEARTWGQNMLRGTWCPRQAQIGELMKSCEVGGWNRSSINDMVGSGDVDFCGVLSLVPRHSES
jgi:hypothetical protein